VSGGGFRKTATFLKVFANFLESFRQLSCLFFGEESAVINDLAKKWLADFGSILEARYHIVVRSLFERAVRFCFSPEL
jgi:hypothetical protein